MLKRSSAIVAAVGAFACSVLTCVPVQADDTGLAQILHALRREGGKLCQAEHFHTMTGDTAATKKAAMSTAIATWQGFTAAEYGSDWGNFRRAGSKSAKCGRSSSGWVCEVSGRPCR